MLLPVFTGATPQWRCALYEEAGGGSVVNGTEFGNASWKACDKPNFTCVTTHYDDDFTSIVSQVIKGTSI